MPRRGALAVLAGVPAALVAACSPDQEPAPPPPPSTPTPTPTPTPKPKPKPKPKPTVKVSGVKGSLADFAKKVYLGGEIATTKEAAALKKRKPVKKSVKVTASRGDWHGTPVGLIARGKDRTFVVHDGKKWVVVAGWWPDLGIRNRHIGGRRFVAILGSDAREEDGEKVTGARADTLQIAAVDGKGGGGILGIPRDSWANGAKINSVLVSRGAGGQTKALADLTGLPVSHYVITGFRGFRSFVKALGGVTVVSPANMPTRDIPKGKVHLNDNKAMWFARERKSLPNGDFGRSANQQKLLVAFVLAMKAMGPKKFGSLVTVLSRATQTNLPAKDGLEFAAWALSSPTSKVGRKVATGGFGMRSGQSVVLLGGSAQSLFGSFADGDL